MKTPDEIKKGLKYAETNCLYVECCEDTCPYNKDCDVSDPDRMAEIPRAIATDALAYIQQLERERDAAVEAIEHTCATCKHYYYNSADGSDCKYDCLEGADGCHNGNTRWEWRGVEEDDHA